MADQILAVPHPQKPTRPAPIRRLDYSQMMALGRRLLDKHGLTEWAFDVVNLQNTDYFLRREGDSGKALGLCVDSIRTIYLDVTCSSRDFRQTVLHEIAHALTPKDSGHGPAWMDKADEVGCTFRHVYAYFCSLKRGWVGNSQATSGEPAPTTKSSRSNRQLT